ncbi:hypothetical protein KSX_06120 [Ktedonospora formicarum]|uniref:Uncharacterized protein n=1 Tax=Ktedonospora formicarum TaxID=2778364 RepID=A0A8J3HRT8_9CHLR|nr:hypothetical protein KSX_06120 [Ktedonospora formicarum]
MDMAHYTNAGFVEKNKQKVEISQSVPAKQRIKKALLGTRSRALYILGRCFLFEEYDKACHIPLLQ